MEDKTLECKHCGKAFGFSASEQEFFAKNGLTNEPSKCKDCRRKAREEKLARQTVIGCTHCGKQEHITFTVAHPETLLCDDCFHALQPAYGSSSNTSAGKQPESVDLTTASDHVTVG